MLAHLAWADSHLDSKTGFQCYSRRSAENVVAPLQVLAHLAWAESHLVSKTDLRRPAEAQGNSSQNFEL